MFNSLTYGKLTQEQVFEKIIEKVEAIKRSGYDYELSVGTDSQTYSQTNIVTSILVRTISKGGIYFSKKKYTKRFPFLRNKIYAEVADTLEIAEDLRNYLREHGFTATEVYNNLIIDIDIGNVGPTSELIAGITGWVTALGFKYRIKPHSIASSRVSNKITKHGPRERKLMSE